MTIASEVDEHWRGAYDLLVRPLGSRLDLEDTSGVVEPNFLGFAGEGGISLDELAAIRRLPEVEIAAPISVVGQVEYVAVAPNVSTTRFPAQHTLYRLDLKTISDDGVGGVLVQRERVHWVLGADAEKSSVLYQARSSTRSDNEVDITLEVLPTFSSTVIGVDPGSERALLGESASFLDVFGRLSSDAPYEIGSFDVRLVPSDQFRLARLDLLDAQSEGEPLSLRPVVPIVVSARSYASTTLTLDVSSIGEPFPTLPTDLPTTTRDAIAEILDLAGSAEQHVGTSTLDASARILPFQTVDLTVPWPGTEPPGLTAAAAPEGRFEVRLADRPRYEAITPREEGGPLAFAIAPRGPVSTDGRPAEGPNEFVSLPGSVVEQGREQSYRSLSAYPLAVSAAGLDTDRGDRPFYFAPLGQFDLDDLDGHSDLLSYVPLGAYDPPDTELVVPSAAGAPAGQPVLPTLNPAGLVAVPPLAITDLTGAVTLRGSEPIDAVRVRIRGLTGYDAAGRALVERVAGGIAEMGLDVDVVAGSSPQPVDIFVPRYRIVDGSAEDLGWVRQGWTTLGAAERTERGLGITNAILLLLGLATAVTFAVVMEVGRAARRVREAALLRSVGWGRSRIVRWLAGESIVAGVAVALLGTMAWLVLGRSTSALAGVVVLASVLPLVGLAAAALATRRDVGGALAAGDQITAGWLARSRVRGPFSLAMRDLLSRPVRTISIMLALVLGSTSVALAAWLIGGVVARVGPTYLASALTLSLRPYQFGLLVLTLIGGLVLTALALRSAIGDRHGELTVLVASGWSPSEVRGVLGWGDRLIGIMAAPVAFIVAALAALPVAQAPPLLAGVTAAGAAVSIAIWGALLRRGVVSAHA